MDVQAITASIVDTKSKSSTGSAGTIDASSSNNLQGIQQQQQQTQLNDYDMRRVNAIEWIVYDVTQRVKLLDYDHASLTAPTPEHASGQAHLRQDTARHSLAHSGSVQPERDGVVVVAGLTPAKRVCSPRRRTWRRVCSSSSTSCLCAWST